MTYDESPLKTAHGISKDLREQLAAVTKERDELREACRDLAVDAIKDVLASQPEDA